MAKAWPRALGAGGRPSPLVRLGSGASGFRPPPPPAPSESHWTRHQTRRPVGLRRASSLCLRAASAPPDRACAPADGRTPRREGERTEPSGEEAGPSARAARSLGTMGPRRLLLVAAGLSLCGPLLSARTRGRKQGESFPGYSLPAPCGPLQPGPPRAWSGRERGPNGVQAAPSPRRRCPWPHPLSQVAPEAKQVFEPRSTVSPSRIQAGIVSHAPLDLISEDAAFWRRGWC